MIRNQESEFEAISLALRDPGAMRRLKTELSPDHFYEETHRLVFKAATKVADEHDRVDMARLVDYLGDGLQKIGGKAFLAKLRISEGDPAALTNHISTLHEGHAHRKLVKALQDSLHDAQDGQEALSTLASRVEARISKAARYSGSQGAHIEVSEILGEALAESLKVRELGNGLVGFSSGIPEMDEAIGGLEPGHVTVIMGESGLGKTAIAMQMVANASRTIPVAYANLEMPASDMGQRLQAMQAEVSFHRIRRGITGDMEDKKIANAMSDMAENMKLYMSPGHIQTWEQITNWFREKYYDVGARVMVLDNILSVDYDGVQEIEHVTRIANASQRLARELDVSLINLHHTNTSDRPDLRSMHGSKAVQRHSSNIIGMYKPDMFMKTVEFIVLKGRNEGVSTFNLDFEGELQKFFSPQRIGI